MAFRRPVYKQFTWLNQTCLPVMLAYSDALQGRAGEREDWVDVLWKRQKAQRAYKATSLHLWSPASSIRPIAVKGFVCSVQGRGDPGIQPVGASQATSCGQKRPRVIKGLVQLRELGGGGCLASRPASWLLVRDLALARGRSAQSLKTAPFLDGILDRAARFGRVQVLLPELLPIPSVNGIGSGSPTLLRL